MKFEPYICPQCGGQIDRARMVCMHCGTQFKEHTDVIKIVAERPGVHTLTATAALQDEVIAQLGAEKASEIALKEIARKMSNAIMPYLSVQTSDKQLLSDNCMVVRGRLRILDPKEWAY